MHEYEGRLPCIGITSTLAWRGLRRTIPMAFYLLISGNDRGVGLTPPDGKSTTFVAWKPEAQAKHQ